MIMPSQDRRRKLGSLEASFSAGVQTRDLDATAQIELSEAWL